MALVPGRYVLVGEAGRGATARVYYCLPDTQVEFVKVSGKLTTDSIGFPGLRRSLVAVKLSPNRDLIYREYGVLQAIKLSTAPKADEIGWHFTTAKDIGDFGVIGHQRASLAMEALDPPISLEDVLHECSTEVKIPVPLVYRFFLSLAPALIFLRDELERTHNDVKCDNIMLRYAPEHSPFSLPGFLFIDLAMSYSLEDARNQSSDCKNFLGLVKRMAEKADASGDQEWLDFRRMLDDETLGGRLKSDVDADFGKIWNRWKDVADKVRSTITVGEVDRIEELFERVAQRKRRVSDKDIVRAVEARV